MPLTLPSKKPATRQIALALLIAATVLYGVSMAMGGRSPHSWWSYVAAFAEAAMIGAIADWFAVVALFRHPLGIPIPHTAIVPLNKNRIGENLAKFFSTHFLAKRFIARKIRDWNVVAWALQWLSDPARTLQAKAVVSHGLRMVVEVLRRKEVASSMAIFLRTKVAGIPISPMLGRALGSLIEQRKHQEVLDLSLMHLAQWFGEAKTQEAITHAIAEEVRSLRYVGLDKVAAKAATKKVLRVVGSTIIEVAEQVDHPLRLRFEAALLEFSDRMLHDSKTQAQVEQWKAQWLTTLWNEESLLTWWNDWMQDVEHTHLSSWVDTIMGYLLEAMRAQGAVNSPANRWVRLQVPRMVEAYREDIAQYITARVHAWDAWQMSAELEKNLGNDLQFVRINGTLVGGCVGLLLHTVTHAW